MGNKLNTEVVTMKDFENVTSDATYNNTESESSSYQSGQSGRRTPVTHGLNQLKSERSSSPFNGNRKTITAIDLRSNMPQHFDNLAAMHAENDRGGMYVLPQEVESVRSGRPIERSGKAIIAIDLRSNMPQNFVSLEAMHAENARGGRYVLSEEVVSVGSGRPFGRNGKSICAVDLRSNMLQNFVSLEAMYAENDRGGRYKFKHDGPC